MKRFETAINHHILRWAGHVTRTPENSLPNQFLYSEQTTGKRPRGAPKEALQRPSIRYVGAKR